MDTLGILTDGSNSSSSDGDISDFSDAGDGDSPDIGDDVQELRLGISEAHARTNYVKAGEEVIEEPERITLAGNADLVEFDVNDAFEKIVNKLELPYEPSEFQRVAVNAVGSQKNLILVSPTGSGKMDVPFLSVLLLRERTKNPKGICIVTQPLTSIMNEKIQSNICPVAVLSMTGQLKFSSSEGVGHGGGGCDDDDDDASLSCDLEDLLDGSFPVLMGHPESFDSNLGQHILRELQKLERLICVCIDEFHQGGEAHWRSFRPDMMKRSTGLRLYGVPGCPTISMTATATSGEIDEVKHALGLRVEPVILTSSPVQDHIKFSIIRRPSNNFGLEGTVKKNGVRNPGLFNLLDRVFLHHYVKDLKQGVEPKRAIIFCRGNGVLGAIYSHVMKLTMNQYQDCRDAPFVMNHASLLPPTEKVLKERSSEISLYLSSNKMLLGVNLSKIDIIIFLRPYNHPSAMIQGGGRGGRKQENGMRRRVQVYQFFNSQDFTAMNKDMCPDMKRICQSEECTRPLLKDFFVGNSEPQEDREQIPDHCCHHCDLKLMQDVQ